MAEDGFFPQDIINQDVKYPIFLKALANVDDEYWINIFKGLSNGISPKGVYVNEKYITCSIKNAEFSLNYTLYHYNELYDILKSRFKKCKYLYSSLDKNERQTKIKTIRKELQNQQFEKSNVLRNKTCRNIALFDFVLSKQEKYNLTNEYTEQLVRILHDLINRKIITNHDIFLEDGKIITIKGITFNTSGRIEYVFDKKPKYKETYKKTSTKEYMHTYWESYLNRIDNDLFSVKHNK